MVQGFTYKTKSGEEKELKVGGIFVEIGAVPSTEYIKDLLKLTEEKNY